VSFSAHRRIQFCAGHRVMNHGSKCRNMHGHNYVAHIHARATALDSLGMVIDFGVLKEVVGGWIDEKWDHGFIYYEKDLVVKNALHTFQAGEVAGATGDKTFYQKMFELPTNPTAENMAQYLLETANELLRDHGVEVWKVVLEETENCSAEVQLGRT
jgi:6-pyruvoyltetrahydropterin/6-carboxytetrahydropterin synthase